MKYPRLFGPWRRTLHFVLVLTVLAVPFISINGYALLRLDIPSLTLFLAGHALRIEELYIFWIFGLSFIFLFLLITLTLGRVWCGWLCPQTVFSDIADSLEKNIKVERLPQLAIVHTAYLFLALLIGANFVWYFINPATFFDKLITGTLGPWPTGTILTLATIIYCDLAFIRRIFCQDFCPYGRFQTVLIDQATLTIQAHPSHIARCIDCKACVKVCPTGIDIRSGFQIECINCSLCLDACRKMMAKKGEPGIIQYTFGQNDLQMKALFSAKTITFFTIFLCLFSIGLYLSVSRSAVHMTIGRSPDRASITLQNGRLATFYSGSLVNRRNTDQTFSLTVRGEKGEKLNIQGPTVFTVKPNERKQLNFAVLSNKPLPGAEPLPLVFFLTDRTGTSVGEVQGFISGITEK